MPWNEYVNELASGLLNVIASSASKPVNELRVNVNPPWVQEKASGVNDEMATDPLGQGAALAGAAPTITKLPAATKRLAPSLKCLDM